MKLQTGATQVALRTSQLMRAGTQSQVIPEPSWYRTVLLNPPTHTLLPQLRQLKKYENMAKPPVVSDKPIKGVYSTRTKGKYNTQGKHLYKLPKIRYEEDLIRRQFYLHHPWELARPKNVVETNGLTTIKCDWSTIRQPRLRLSGENVVQRTLWLAKQPEYQKQHGSNWQTAYEQARLEFYRLRIEEHAEQAVALEEATMLGAVFEPSMLEHDLQVEQRVIDKFSDVAKKATKAFHERRA